MLFKLFKAVGLLLLGCCLFAVVALSILFFKPSVLLLAVNKWTDYEVVAQDIQLGVTPLDLHLQSLQVIFNAQSLLEIEAADLSFDWRGYLSDRHTLWRGDFSNGTIDLRALPQSTNNAETSGHSQSRSLSIQLHAILTALNGQIESLDIILNDQSTLMISNLATQLDGNEQQGYQTLKQNISLALKLNDDDKVLSLGGLFSSSRDSNVTNLGLDLQAVDLSGFVSSSDENQTDVETKDDVEIATETKQVIAQQVVIDWSWLEILDDMSINLTTPKVVLDKNTLEDVSMKVTFDDAINLQQVSAKIDWGLSEELSFVDSLALSGTIKPLATEISGVDVDVNMAITSPKFELQANGQLNLNAASDQQVSLDLSMNTFPVYEQEGDLFKGLLQQYLPINLSTRVTTDTNKVNVEFDDSSFGETKFNSILNIENFDQEVPKFNVSLNAEKLSFQSPVNDQEDQMTSDDSTGTEDKGDAKVFSDSPIDYSFMQFADVEAELDIKEFSLNEVTVENVLLNGALNSVGQGSDTSQRLLAVKELSANIAEGEISGVFELTKSDQPAQIKLALDVNGLELESLSFMPQEQLSGGDLTIDTDLEFIGDSLATLAASSNGQFYLDVSDAIVQNDRFELIGSDLVLELLSKLNPFSKSDPTTKLECAAVYVPFENGVAKLDNSIALQTSKLVVVADGLVNLNSEKLNLKISPTSKAGVGVNVSSMVKFIKLGGTLAKPTPEIDAGGVVTSGLAAGVAISTGGASLLATGLLDKVTKNHVCEKVQALYKSE